MILKTVWLIKVLMIAIAILFAWRLFSYKLGKRALTFVTVLCLCTGALSNLVAGYIPPLMDEIQLTALNEVGSAGKGKEIFFAGYSVDGVPYMPENAIEGKWFWIGDNYCWRPETDQRQPEGTTRTITVKIPVGWNRTVLFAASEWRGWVEVIDVEGAQRVDTAVTSGVSVAQSTKMQLVLSNGRQLLCYALIVTVLILGLFAACQWVAVDQERAGLWWKRYWYHFLLAGIALSQFLFAARYSGVDSLWFDELATIYSLEHTSIWNQMFGGSITSILPPLVWTLWYKVSPYGEQCLLFICEIATAIGIYFVGLSGKEIKNIQAGIFACVLTALSSTILTQCSYEYRNYAFCFMGFALLLYFYAKRLQQPNCESKGILVALSISMTFFAQMHYVGVVLCVGLFLVDFLLFLKKKVSLHCIIPYIVAAISYLPILVMIVKNHTVERMNVSSWQPVPTPRHVVDLANYLLSYSSELKILLLVGVGVVLLSFFYNWKKHLVPTRQDIGLGALLFVIVFTIGFIYFYGNVIRPEGSLWVSRYFIGLVPCALILCASGLDEIISLFQGVTSSKIPQKVVVLLLAVCLLAPNLVHDMLNRAQRVREPYRQAADWLYWQGNSIYNSDTLVLAGGGSGAAGVTISWNDYYMTRRGQRDGVNVVWDRKMSPEELENYNRVYVMYCHSNISETIQQELEQNYTLVQERGDICVREYARNEK